nr:hypothetical protein [Tanacetum cinerariifolium]
ANFPFWACLLGIRVKCGCPIGVERFDRWDLGKSTWGCWGNGVGADWVRCRCTGEGWGRRENCMDNGGKVCLGLAGLRGPV